jgi:HEPN domain-containing protein
MKPITREWVEKAEGDFRSARRELRVRSHPNHDLVCFLSQQCAEKYLKAQLVEAGISFPKTHDLVALLKMLLPVEPLLASVRCNVDGLTDYAVEFRYPSESATKEEARAALADCHAVRMETRKILGVDEPPSAQMSLRIKEKRGRYKVRRKKKRA